MFLDRLGVILEPQSFLGILSQELLDQVAEGLGTVLREADDALAHFLVELGFCLCVEGGDACEQLVEDDAVFVPVGHSGVAFLVDYLEGEVGRGAAEGFVDCVQVSCFLRKTEVRDTSMALSIKHDVLRLHVPVDDHVLVQGLDPQQNLSRIHPHNLLFQSLFLFQKPREVPSFTVVHH